MQSEDFQKSIAGAIFISGNVPSLKNSKISTKKGVFHSKSVAKFLRLHGIKSYSSLKKNVESYKTIPDTFKISAMQLKEMLSELNTPYMVRYYFVRKTNARFDFGNAVELLADLFTSYNVWEDDNCSIYLPFPWIINGNCFHVDKLNPGVYISIIK